MLRCPSPTVMAPDFAAAAAAAGAAAALDRRGRASPGPPTGLPVLVARSVRGAAGPLAALLHGTAAGPALIGVTGTNGKTTTTYCRQVAAAARRAADRDWSAPSRSAPARRDPQRPHHPGSPGAARLLAPHARTAASTRAAMEVSSHAMALTGGRRPARSTWRSSPTCTQDHLDLHGTHGGVLRHQGRACSGVLHAPRRAVPSPSTTPGAVPDGAGLRRRDVDAGHRRRTDGHDADWRVRGNVAAGLGTASKLHGPDGAGCCAPAPGCPAVFNVSNAALAVLMVHGRRRAAGRDLAGGSGSARPAHRRGARAHAGDLPSALPRIVDFAHNPDALASARLALGGQRPARLPGDRGLRRHRPARRHRSARSWGRSPPATRDIVVITDDDPHGRGTRPHPRGRAGRCP